MSNPSSPTRKRVRGLLAENGEVRAAPGTTRGLVISRALCRFRRFLAPVGLTRGQRDKAALLHAEAHAPFTNSGWLALRTEDGAEIWYWDRDRLPLGALTPSPETIWRSGEDGWRVLCCIDGYEAQYVEGGALLASTWRREPFDRAHWASFVASVDAGAADAPEVAPRPQSLALINKRWRQRMIRAPLGLRDLEHGAWSIAAIALVLSFFFSGQALHHGARADAAVREVREVEARLTADPDLRRARERQGLTLAVSDIVGAPTAATLFAETLEVLDGYAITPRAISVEGGEFQALIDQPDQPVREVVRRLEETGRFCSVTPEVVAGGGVELRGSIKSRGGEVCAIEAGGGL